jgi:hypothetical protein
MIGAEFGRDDYNLIPTTAIGRELKRLDVEIDPQIKSNVKIKK